MSDPAEPTATAEPTETTIKRFLCRHIHTSGSRCGSPALRGEPFCYYHHTTRRPAPRHRGVHPEHAVFELPAIDDRSGVQFALAQVLARISTNQLDYKRSGRLLHGLSVASRNLRRELRPASPATRSDSRSSRHSSLDSASSTSAGNSNNPEDIVEDLILDSDLGPIAPIAEIRPPEPPQPRLSLLDRMMQEFGPIVPIPDPTQRLPPTPHFASNQQPTTNNQQPATDNLQPATVLLTRAPYNRTMPFESLRQLADADFPTRWGHFRILGFEGVVANPKPCNAIDPPPPSRVESAIALVMGDPTTPPPPIVRIHSQCLTGDVFHSLRCDCRQQLELALAAIAAAGRGILIYESKEGRGIGLMAKLQAYQLQDQGLDTVEANLELGFQADCRQYELPAAILTRLGVPCVRLITNNPEKVAALESAGIQVAERISAQVPPQPAAARYLKTKQKKMGHLVS